MCLHPVSNEDGAIRLFTQHFKILSLISIINIICLSKTEALVAVVYDTHVGVYTKTIQTVQLLANELILIGFYELAMHQSLIIKPFPK